VGGTRDERQNGIRAEKAAKAIGGGAYIDPDKTANLVDLLTDVQHWAFREGLDYTAAQLLAVAGYSLERGRRG